MSNKKFTQLPTVPNATLADIICAVQGGVSVQETLSQVSSLFLANTVLSYAGNPNGHLAGSTFQLCWDTVDQLLYICTTSGTALTAVWTETSLNGLVTPTHGGTGVVNPTAHAVAIAEGASNFNFLTLGNGQLLIGSTGLDPVPATLTAGTNVSITNGAGTITISTTGMGAFSWSEVTGTSQAMAVNTGYIANNVALVTLTLPVSSVVGDMLRVVGKGTGGWTVAQNASQTIHLGINDTTVGVGGSLSSTNRYDAITMVCTVANLEWTICDGPEGIITIV